MNPSNLKCPTAADQTPISDWILLRFSSERKWKYIHKTYGEVVVWQQAQWVGTQSRDCWRTSRLWKLQSLGHRTFPHCQYWYWPLENTPIYQLEKTHFIDFLLLYWKLHRAGYWSVRKKAAGSKAWTNIHRKWVITNWATSLTKFIWISFYLTLHCYA